MEKKLPEFYLRGHYYNLIERGYWQINSDYASQFIKYICAQKRRVQFTFRNEGEMTSFFLDGQIQY